jgi:hypothetical protein
MKLLNKILASTTLALAAVSSQAAIISPATGSGELIAILYTAGNQNSFVLDLGFTLATFDVNTNQSFNLSASPYYSTFLSNNTAASPVVFAVLGGDSTGLITAAGSKNMFITSAANTTPPTPTSTLLNNRIGPLESFGGALNSNSGVVSATFSGNHNTLTDGSSLSSAPSTSTSFSTLNAGTISPSGITMVASGSQAELFKLSSGAGASANGTVTDFFSDTETDSNLGGYFVLNSTTGTLDYFGAPSVINPVPEASEWAMMLSGLSMLGLMVRRRRNNI